MLCASSAVAQAPIPPQSVSRDSVPIALLVDATSGQVLYSHEADRRFVPASITKAMTLYTAFERIDQGTLTPNQEIVVPRSVWENWKGRGSRMFLNVGDRVAIADLLTGIANISANDASAVLAHTAAGSIPNWTREMNAQAQSIGMSQSHFATPNGWPDEGQTFTTANDLVKLGCALVAQHPRKFERFIGHPGFSYAGINQVNHDPLLGRFAGADGIKTGYTNEAGFGFLGTAKRGDRRLMLVIAGASRKRLRDTAALDLMEWGFAQFESRALFAQGQAVGHARVQDGEARSVALMTNQPIAIQIPRDGDQDVKMAIVYDGPLRAPIIEGERVATLEISTPDGRVTKMALNAQSSIAKAGFWTRIGNAVAGLFS